MNSLTFNIVAIDNFARDYNGGKSERLIGSACNEETAKAFAKAWNERWGGDHASDYAVVRPSTDPLYQFEGY